MKTAVSAFSAALIFLVGCSSTYQRACRVRLESDPSQAEIWKGRFFEGRTPRVLHYTATAEDDERGYLRIPPLTIRKEGYQPYLVEMELDLKESGDFWEAMVVLEPEE